MRVQDVMSQAVQTISASTGAAEAWNLMRLRSIRHLVVVDGSEVVGVLSDRDAGGRRGGAVRRNVPVRDLMTSPAVTVPAETTVRKAANLMRGRSIGSVVVTRGRRIEGILTTSDLLDLLGRGADRGIEQAQRRGLKHRVAHRKSSSARGVW